ncbi:MAG TPA: PspC domain-containing protein [Acidobacteriota bacterium]|nr:PspC domain-containing protein [Acidobacteriota bacterium]
MSGEGNSEVKHLYRSRKDRILGGVCGGLAEYLEVDPTIVRLLWVISVFVFGFGVLLYIIALFLVPNNPKQTAPEAAQAAPEQPQQQAKPKADWNLAVGIVLLVLGVIFLLGEFDFFDYRWFRFHFFPFRLFWPLLIIGAGIFFVVSGTTVRDTFNGVREKAAASKLRKSRTDKMIFGVCGGLGKAFDVDPTVIRVLWAIGTLLSGGIIFLAYIVLAVIMPFEDEQVKSEPADGGDSTRHSTV